MHPDLMEIRLEDLQKRYDRACAVAKTLSEGEIDTRAMRTYASDYYSHISLPFRIFDVQEEATQEWANWMGQQADACIQLIRLEREKPYALQLKLFFNDNDGTGFEIANNDGDRALIIQLHADCIDILNAIQNAGILDRVDLREELQTAMDEDHSSLLKKVRSPRAFYEFAAARGRRQYAAFYDAANSFIRANEADMAATMILHKLRTKNARGHEMTLVKLDEDLRFMGKQCGEELSNVSIYLENAGITAQTMPIIINAAQAHAHTGVGLNMH